MKKVRKSAPCEDLEAAARVLRQFITFFESKGWLNRRLVIKRQGTRYRVFCTEKEFLVYRINDNHSRSPGIPGWPVCVVDQDRVLNDSDACPFPSGELSPREWLRGMINGDFEVM